MIVDDLNIRNDCLASFLIKIEGEELQKLQAVYAAEAQKNLNIQGFRAGMAPLKVVAAAYGDSFYNDAAMSLFPGVYNEAVAQNGLEPVGNATFQVVQSDAGILCYLVRVEVYPHIKLRNYKGLRAVRPDDSVSEEELEREVEIFRDNHREVLLTDRQQHNDDLVYFSMKAAVNGKPFPGSTTGNMLQRMDFKEVFPGLKEHLTGCKTGDTFTYEVDIPADDDRETIAGKRVSVNVRVGEIKERRLRPVNDELFVPAYESKADFLEKRRAELEKVRKIQADDVFEKGLRRALCDEVEGGIPDSMIDQQTSELLVKMSGSLEGGITRFLKENNMTPDDFKAEVRKNAIENLKYMLAVDYIAAAEDIEEEDDERREKKAFRIVVENAVPIAEEKN